MKYERFKDKAGLEADPLVRWCTKPGCESHMRGKNNDEVKLKCLTCGTEVCFKCRDEWHGEDVTCEQHLHSQLEGWASQNKDNVSFCPCCRTKIEKNQGCNHMTCVYCRYEFCWACGESATSAEGHFAGNGCGVGQMDESVRPGDHLKRKSFMFRAQQLGKILCTLLTVLVLYIPFLVFFVPVMFSMVAYEQRNPSLNGICSCLV